MGNCSLKGVAAEDFSPNSSIRVLTDAGQIINFQAPKLARDIVSGYPGYGVFRRGNASSPLPDNECLVNGGFYYLLPLEKVQKPSEIRVAEDVKKVEVEWMNQIEPPKMSSAEFVESLASGPALEVLPSQKNGVWRVKLVINTKQLEEILSEEVNTEALIEKMRMAAVSSASGRLTPKRSKGPWVVGWKPTFSSVFKAPTADPIKAT